MTHSAFLKRFRWTHKSSDRYYEERAGTLLGVPVWYRVSTNPVGPLGRSACTTIRYRVDNLPEGSIETLGGRTGAAEKAKDILRERVALMTCDE